jgi:uncharacterized protein YecE (DUF72 family)
VRHSSWFNDNGYDFLRENNISLVWSIRDKLRSPPNMTSNQVYIRFIGDTSISEMDFGKIVKNRRKDMLEYVKQVGETQNENSNIHDVLIAFNNHFAGFCPQSVNDFLKLMNMSEIVGRLNWNIMKIILINPMIDFNPVYLISVILNLFGRIDGFQVNK